jgi:aspartate aminotransferase-like enzyme
VRLLAGGGPSSPDPRVLRALTTPLIGQFDPAFTVLMDQVAMLARKTFQTTSPHCFAISALASGGLEAVLNSLVQEADRVAVGGSPAFVKNTAELVRRCRANPIGLEDDNADAVVVPYVDPFTCQTFPVEEVAKYAHERQAQLVVEATLGLATRELRVDQWAIDVCVAGADYAVGAPSGMSLVTYTPEVQARMEARKTAPTTSYLDLLQLQAYWSPERLNHHTAPTSLVYGLHEALRLLHDEGLSEVWARHAEVGTRLRDGLKRLGLEPSGDLPYSVVRDSPDIWPCLLEEYDVHVTLIAPHTWRVGLIGSDAQPEHANVVLAAIEKALNR